jgi:transposase-like protein
VLVRFKSSNEDFAELVASGGSVREAVGVDIPQRRRRELTIMLDEFEAARHEFRQALFAVCLEEGATISEIGRALGVSRQRASRLVREATGAAHLVHGPPPAWAGVDGGAREPT